MPKRENRLFSRIGSYRNGQPADIPHKFEEAGLKEFIRLLKTDEKVDLLSLVEANLERNMRKDIVPLEQSALSQLIRILRSPEVMKDMEGELQRLGLLNSPSLVRFGQRLMLGREK